MALFDKFTDIKNTVVQKSGEIADTVVQKSGELAESGKLTVNIKKKEKEIAVAKAEIGKYIYEQYKNAQTFDEKITGLCQEIDEAYAEIAKLEESKEALGADDAEIEVVEAAVAEGEFEVSAEEEEILKNL